ncbi:Nucleotidyltransferase [Sistotremastrum niveocremeum HHB9708]|uniref:Nucleotidyltransferase n=1 Tax=Sistotremastrum niveocremeum HHB9708 TaxID=1314777 RepID=A0A164Q4J0_9AGAM|nr:Nucleotidyltransferase [Sistotremastrum niveocremeum HHB9708]
MSSIPYVHQNRTQQPSSQPHPQPHPKQHPQHPSGSLPHSRSPRHQQPQHQPVASSSSSGSSLNTNSGSFPTSRSRDLLDTLAESGIHSQGVQHYSEKGWHLPWLDDFDMRSATGPLHLLGKEICALEKFLMLSREERIIYQVQLQKITSVITTVCPSASVVPFGSFQTGTSMPTSDLDLSIIFEEGWPNQEEVLRHIAAEMAIENIAVPSSINLICNAKSSLLKFRTAVGNIAVDISVNKTNGPEAIPLAQAWLKEHPTLRSLLLVTKLYFHMNGWGQVYTGGFGGYAIMVFIRSFLKRRVEVSKQGSERVGAHFLALLCELGNRPLWEEYGIASDGTLARRSELLKACGVPGKPAPFFIIQDPCNPGNNLAGGSFMAQQICDFSMQTASNLTLALHLVKCMDPSIVRRTILGVVVGVSDSLLRHREGILNIYDSMSGLLDSAALNAPPPPPSSRSSDSPLPTPQKKLSRLPAFLNKENSHHQHVEDLLTSRHAMSHLKRNHSSPTVSAAVSAAILKDHAQGQICDDPAVIMAATTQGHRADRFQILRAHNGRPFSPISLNMPPNYDGRIS